MKLIVISDPNFLPEEAQLINRLFTSGLSYFHLRKPESSRSQYANLLAQIDPAFRSRIAVHQLHEQAKELGITRLHFPERERCKTSALDIDQLVKQGYILSTSTHDLSAMKTLSQKFSYAFYGPVFDSISKPGYTSKVPDGFMLKNEFKKIPVIGLGGINIQNMSKAIEMNFDGITILGALWQDPVHAIENFEDIKKILAASHDQ